MHGETLLTPPVTSGNLYLCESGYLLLVLTNFSCIRRQKEGHIRHIQWSPLATTYTMLFQPKIPTMPKTFQVRQFHIPKLCWTCRTQKVSATLCTPVMWCSMPNSWINAVWPSFLAYVSFFACQSMYPWDKVEIIRVITSGAISVRCTNFVLYVHRTRRFSPPKLHRDIIHVIVWSST